MRPSLLTPAGVASTASAAADIRDAIDRLIAPAPLPIGDRVPTDLVRMLQRVGAFRMSMPRSWGGLELDPMGQVEVIEHVARLDASLGWLVMIGSDSGYYSSRVDDTTARTIWTHVDAITAGQIAPTGVARRVGGGYRVTGRWSFGSGIEHADVLVGGVMATEASGRRTWRLAALDRDAVAVNTDSWDTTGLRGTRSLDYSVTDAFVAEDHIWDPAGPPQRGGALYVPAGGFMDKFSGVALGAARAAVDHMTTLMRQQSSVSDLDAVELAETVGRLGAARAHVFATLERSWTRRTAGQPEPPEERAEVHIARRNAWRAAVDIVLRLADLAGTSSIRTGFPLERLRRDVVTGSQHSLARRSTFIAAGHQLLGRTTGELFL